MKDLSQAPRILLVEDNSVVRALMVDVVTMLGYQSDAAASGPEALTLFELGHYDIVLTDLLMPRMTGWEVLEALRLRDPKIPVVVVTGSPVPIDDARLSQPGVALMRKPLDIAALGHLISRMLAGRLVS